VKETFRQLLDNLPIGALVVDQSQRIIYLNRAFALFTGYEVEELQGVSLQKVTAPPRQSVADKIERLLQHETSYFEVETRYRCKDGTFVWGSPVRMLHPHPVEEEEPSILIFVVDITERRLLAKKLRNVERMNALGLLAGGIAHDFNNLLTLIKNFGGIIKEDIGDEALRTQAIEQILKACDRGEELTQRLLAIGKPESSEITTVDLNELIEEVQFTFSRVLPTTITIDVSLDVREPQIVADGARLYQIVTNLMINARQAMNDQGTIRMETGLVSFDDPELADVEGLSEGTYGKIRICDSGTGISRELLPHIFKPFFTTKGDEGTGMGLSTVYDIIQEDQGYVRVESQVDQGTCFDIYLPTDE
jgi:two-component system, cell cycle sensor histidine kinase and response regulator CckA